jgi:hypothetical protein
VTRPTISWPGTHGQTVGIRSCHSSRCSRLESGGSDRSLFHRHAFEIADVVVITRLEEDSPRLCGQTDTLSVQQSTASGRTDVFVLVDVGRPLSRMRDKISYKFVSVCSFFDNWRISTTPQRSDWGAKRKCHSYFTPSQLRVARGVLFSPSCKIR